ncbi:hypothetical protein D0A34_23625 [Microcoleus vaginatus PCC 9802]|uniref:hypothetical protein n=1 Tax=Microcoleus vaginatus TaxID=119532 RepID=UPI00020D10A7|nr:hypothetical protein MicvaDRAFT_1760 [Microcoleus vaginatus FGP-2]UNU21436.1 hypothetical protein D0A34_23625 [Microcoleus vaginatus PCC 9802]
MAENQLENTRTFRRSITSADGTGIIEILNCANAFAEYDPLSASYYLGKSFYLEALSGAIYLPSYQEAPYPDIYPEMSAAEKIAAMLAIEKGYPFVGLSFHARKGTGAWSTLATARLQNKGRETTIPFTIPYLTINQLKLLSPDDRLGISIINYGHGVLGNGDYINLEGDFRFNLDLIAKPQIRTIGAGLPYGIEIPSAAPTRFRTANQNRAILYATNTGNTDIWIAGNSSVAVGSGIFLARNGGGNLTEQTLTGELWAIADGGPSRLSGVEASYV